MKNLFFCFVLLSVSSISGFSQNCNCPGSFDWMVDTFKTNDAGFQYVVDKKGTDEYAKHTNHYRDKALNTTLTDSCLSVLNKWLSFFRKGHIGAFPKNGFDWNVSSGALSDHSKDSIRALYRNEEIIDFSERQFKEFLNRRQGKMKAIEGIWKSNTYSIGIMQSPGKENQFVAFIIKADSVYWLPKQKKALFSMDKDSAFSVVYSMRDHSKKNEKARIVGKSGNILLMMNTIWLKDFPTGSLTQKEELFLKLRNARSPFMNNLSKMTLYLRIPSFDYSQKTFIDSLLLSNDSLIRKTPNLIIDIRNGTGGSDLSFFGLMPYLYTQPIRTVDMKYLATELNAEGYEDYAKVITDTANAIMCRRIASKMRQHIGTFITWDSSYVSVDSSYVSTAFPRKIAIICNQYNGSTDESFLIQAKQSSKVKVFGRPTAGFLDFSNVHVVDFPNGLFKMMYSMTASFRIPDFPIDGIGIQPDFYIDDTIPEEDWIYFVQSTMERWSDY
jgi:hypothetical protein